MIINSLCNTCFQPYELLIEASEVELLKQIADESGHTAPCPRLCGGTINIVGDRTIAAMATDPRNRDPLRINGKELYQAVNGLGLPDELPLNKDVIELLLNTKVTSIVCNEIGGKYYLGEICFEGDRVMHLTSGPRGAQVLKITKMSQLGPLSPGNPL